MAYSKDLMIGLATFCLVLPPIFVVLRVWAKLIRAGLSLDDYLILPALFLCIGACICQYIGAIHGRLGQHQPLDEHGIPILDHGFRVFADSKFGLQMVSILGLGLTKASILVFYMNLFKVQKIFKYMIWTMLFLVFGWTVSFTLVSIFQCTPVTSKVEPFWGNKCINTPPFYLATSITDMVMDVIILVMPIPMVWQLQLSKKLKLAVLGMFFLGTLTCAASIARFAVFFQIVEELAIHGPDITYWTAPSVFWTVIEQSLAIVSACLPTLRPLFQKKEPSTVSGSYATMSAGSRYQKRHYRLKDQNSDVELGYQMNTLVEHNGSKVHHEGPGIKVQKDVTHLSSDKGVR